MTPRPARDAGVYATLALTALALAARLLAVWRVPPGLAWDGVIYERGARAIASGLGYTTFMFEHRASDTVPTAFYPVGYPAFAAALYTLFGARVLVLELAGAVASALTVAVAHRIAWRIAPGWPAHAAALALALMPGQIVFAGAPMTEPLSALLVSLAVYACSRRPEGTRAFELGATSLLVAAAAFVRPQAILLAPLLPLVHPSALCGGRWRGRVTAALVVTAAALACVAPWSARNCASLDGCAFVSTNGGSNLAIGAVPRATGRYIALDDRDGCAGVHGEVARDRCWRGVATASVRRAPWRWLALASEKLDHTLSYESYPIGYLRASHAISVDDARERTLRRAISAPWLAVLALALVALAPLGATAPLPPAGHVAVAAVAASLAPHVLFFGGDRYHLPIVPLVAALAAGAARGLGPLIPSRRVQRATTPRELDARGG